jgi:hypothetical protein
MTTDRANDPKAFRDFLEATLTNGGANLTLDDCLGLWEVENQGENERTATVQAVREALDDMKAGDNGIPARDYLAEVRRRHGLPRQS